MKITFDIFEEMTSLTHLFVCWSNYRRGKRKKQDIQLFERNLEDNIFSLHHDLSTSQYQHGSYEHFFVSDPKQRRISKASVKDRLAHQMVYEALSKAFDEKFIFHSLSSRLGKGTHIGVELLHRMIKKVSANGKKPCYALKMDIKRFFDSVDHQILKSLISRGIGDIRTLRIIDMIINSFKVSSGPFGGVGIPLGNATSQIFANIYLHELDNFVKEELREKYYLRYCDDFIILSNDKSHLESLIAKIREFLRLNLQLELHPKKLIIRKLSQGIDFLGYILFLHHKSVRTRTLQRIKRKLKNGYKDCMKGAMETVAFDQRLQSYLGILSHANRYALSQALKNAYWVRPESTVLM